MTPRLSPWVLRALFFTSGATSLVFEALWLRGFAIVLGGTVYSMSCVLTAFMGGLALGATLATRFINRRAANARASFVRAYGWLEITIGLCGVAVTVALFSGQAWWLALVGPFHQGSAFTALAVDFAFSFCLLLLPSLCMGATLPVLVMGAGPARDEVSLYGFNTFGAATGSLVASFVLLYLFGVFPSAAIAGGVNIVIGLSAFVAARRLPTSDPDAVESAPSAPPMNDGPAWSPRLLLVLAFFSGLLFFAFELVWNRSLSILLGNRVYVTSITLSTVLVCLGIGARVSNRLLKTRSPQRVLLDSYAFAAGALCLGVLAEPAVYTRDPALLALFVLATIPLPAIAMGVAFPLLLTLPPQGVPRGVHVGRLYTVNTVGAMGGSILTGYVLFSALGSTRIVLGGVAILLLSLGLLISGSQGALKPSKLAVATLTTVAMLAFGLRWNTRLSTVPPDEAQVVTEDAYGIFTITETEKGYLSVRCNATELVYLFGAPITQYVQESQAHLPLLFSRARQDVLVIGSGYGITAGAAASWPGIGHVDAVEILPQMVAHADRFERGNHGYHHHPHVSVHVADGRHFLAASPKKYDVISINVSDPYLPGSSSLFSTEFYDLVTRVLADDGIVCQHLFGPDTASLYHGFKRHFRYVAMIPSYSNGVSVIGSQSPLELRNLAAFADPAFAKVLHGGGLDSPEVVQQQLALGAQLQSKLEAQTPAFLNSDVNPALEFRRSPDVNMLMSNF